MKPNATRTEDATVRFKRGKIWKLFSLGVLGHGKTTVRGGRRPVSNQPFPGYWLRGRTGPPLVSGYVECYFLVHPTCSILIYAKTFMKTLFLPTGFLV